MSVLERGFQARYPEIGVPNTIWLTFFVFALHEMSNGTVCYSIDKGTPNSLHQTFPA